MIIGQVADIERPGILDAIARLAGSAIIELPGDAGGRTVASRLRDARAERACATMPGVVVEDAVLAAPRASPSASRSSANAFNKSFVANHLLREGS